MAKKIYRNIKDLPKAKGLQGTDDFVYKYIQRQSTFDGKIKTDAPLGKAFRVRPSTLRNVKVKHTDGTENTYVVINCYDINGKDLGMIYYDFLLTVIPNQFLKENQKK